MLVASIVSVNPFGHRAHTGAAAALLDAVVVAASFAALVVLGTQPFGLHSASSIVGTAATVTVVLGLSVTCFLKGRIFMGVFGVFIPVIALAGALRLAHPTSPWARRRYSEARLERSRARFDPNRRLGRLEREIEDAVAGAPSARSAASAVGDDEPRLRG